MADRQVFGGIELGGTKIVVATGYGDGTVLARSSLPTREPAAVLPEIAAFFAAQPQRPARLGVGAFGPIAIDPAAPSYGHLLGTNKPGWSGFDLVGALGAALDVPVALCTDVGAAAMGEARLGALAGVRLGLYLTVGTGIGGAVVLDGQVLPALLHPEMGHLALTRADGDDAPSLCRFHPHCAEGLAAGPAIIARFGQSLSHMAPGGAEQALIADYLGQLCASLVLTLSPHRMVIGGGVGQTPGLIALVAAAMQRHLGGYAPAGVAAPGFLCPPALGQDAGIIGALIAAAA